MAKKRNTESLKETGLGILEGLNTLENPTDTENNEEQKSKGVKEETNKRVNTQKSKRSFMLTASQIEKIYLLKSKNPDKDLSVIVGNAIDLYFDKINSENLKAQTEKKESVDSSNSGTPKRKLKRFLCDDD